MHLLVTDVLTCPRCGPDFGLVLLADRLENRRVLEGALGCPNCRRTYPITAGLAWLRPEPEAPPEGAGLASRSTAGRRGDGGAKGDGDAAVRLAALLGLERGHGLVLLVGQPPGLDRALVSTVDGIEVVSLQTDGTPGEEREGISRLVAANGTLPFASRSLRGVAVAGAVSDELLGEAARLVVPAGRLVIEGAVAGTAKRLAALGLSPVLDEAGVVVAIMKGPI